MLDSKKKIVDDVERDKQYTYRMPVSRWRRLAQHKLDAGRDIQEILDDAMDLYFEQLSKGKRVLTTEQRHLIEDLLELIEQGEQKAPFMRRVVLDALVEWRRHR